MKTCKIMLQVGICLVIADVQPTIALTNAKQGGFNRDGFATIDLQTKPPENGTFQSPNGTYIQYCSATGCLSGPYMFAQSFFAGSSRLDARSQEFGVAINFVSKTGYAPNWAPTTRYSSELPSTPTHTSIVTNAGHIFQAIGSTCTSAQAGRGPQAGGGRDGSCVWKDLGSGYFEAKGALTLATNVLAGAGPTWGRVENFAVQPQVGPSIAYGNEEDCNNLNESSGAGSPFFMVCHFQGGGSAATFPVFAYNYVGSGAVNSHSQNPYGAFYGWYFSGEPADVGSVTETSDIGIADNALFGIQMLAGRHHLASVEDEGNSTVVIRDIGTHAKGIDLSAGRYAEAPIKLPELRIEQLPKCTNSMRGGIAYVSDQSASRVVWHGSVSGGGSTIVNGLVSCDGRNWIWN